MPFSSASLHFSALLLPAHLQCSSELLLPCSGESDYTPKMVFGLQSAGEWHWGVVLSAGVVGGDFNVFMSHLQRHSVYGRFQRLQLLKEPGAPSRPLAGSSLLAGGGSSSCGAPALDAGFRGCSTAGSGFWCTRLSCSGSWGISPDQGSNPCLLHRQVHSYPLYPQEAPESYLST